MQLLTATLLLPGAMSSSDISTQPRERTAKHWQKKYAAHQYKQSSTVKVKNNGAHKEKGIFYCNILTHIQVSEHNIQKWNFQAVLLTGKT